MKIGKDTIEYVAKLARLKLTEKETDEMSHEIGAVLSYAKKLDELDTSAVKPMEHIIPLRNVFRNDNVEKSLGLEELFSNTPSKERGYFKVPNTF